MLLADGGTPAHDTLPTTQSRRSGTTLALLNDNQTLEWTRRGIEMHGSMHDVTVDNLLWEAKGLADGSEVRLLLLLADFTLFTKSSCTRPDISKDPTCVVGSCPEQK